MAPNGGRNGTNKKKDGNQLNDFKGACPSHRLKDLDKLVLSMKGDEGKIRAKIAEWWEESPQQEEVWEDVGKKTVKKKQIQGGGGSQGAGRSQGPGRGRGRSGAGGRGAGGRDRGGRGRGVEKKETSQAPKPEEAVSKPAEKNADVPVPAAPAVSVAKAPKGAWAARASASASTEPVEKEPQPKPEDSSSPLDDNPLDVGVVTNNDPTPSGINPPMESKPKNAVSSFGNVWATKGSAHLIQAEKPKPVPLAPAPIAPMPVEKPLEVQAPPPVVPDTVLETGLPSAVAWSKGAPSSKPTSASPAATSNVSSSIPTVSSVEDSMPVAPAPAAPLAPEPAAPSNVLNMGHWETGDTDDAQNLDFGFGSFGTDHDVVDTGAAVQASSNGQKQVESSQSAQPTSVSPARPPPGLSLGRMPPMPDAVMVHELENKMENASLNTSANDKPQNQTSLPQQTGAPAPVLPSPGIAQQNYSQYGMPGMYNYNAAAGSGFVGMHTGPVLAGGVVPQHGKPQVGGISVPSITGASAPQPGLYSAQPPAAPSSGNAAGGESGTDAAGVAAGIPPGMPGGMPYGNPALHYGQHQFYMGQHQGGIGYNYPYGQFGGVAQGGFGYQQVMGQNQGYGAPHYDDQSHQPSSHHSGGSGGYQKNSGGGYRGRNSHHNSNQYQNQYNPQHGGYGGQPYGMGYQDHFGQRGGYGPAGMGDPYGMQQGSGSYQSGAHDDQKGKKGGRANGNSGLQQFQQHAPPGTFGLQGQGSDSAHTAGAGAGGWSNQTGGWSGASTPSWQGN